MGRRGPRRVHGRRLASPRSDAGPGRGGRRHRAVDDGVPALRRLRERPRGLQPGPRRLRVHRGTLGTRRNPSVPLRAPAQRDRRRRGSLRGSVRPRGGGMGRRVQVLSRRPVRGVSRQGTTGRLRAQPRSRPAAEPLSGRLLAGGVSLGRGHRGDGGQSEGPGSRHRAAVVPDGRRHPEPDGGIRPGIRVRLHRPDSTLEHRSLDVVVAGRRSDRVHRAPRQGQGARRPERRDTRARASDRSGDGRRAGITRLLARRTHSGLLRSESRRGRHLRDRPGDRGDHQPDRERAGRLRAVLLAGWPLRHLLGARQRKQQAVPARSGDPATAAADVRNA